MATKKKMEGERLRGPTEKDVEKLKLETNHHQTFIQIRNSKIDILKKCSFSAEISTKHMQDD